MLYDQIFDALIRGLICGVLFYFLTWVFRSKARRIKRFSIPFAFIFMTSLILTSVLGYSPFRVTSQSMFPTLQPGYILIAKQQDILKAGDMVLFEPQNTTKTNLLAARIIGMPGDKLKYSDYNNLFVNNLKVSGHSKSLLTLMGFPAIYMMKTLMM